MMNSKLLKLARMVMNLSEIKTNKGELISETVIEVGSEVFIEDANDMLVPAPDGEYVTQDEVTIVVADGKVVEIREKEVEEAPAEEAPAEEQPAEEPLAEEPAEEQPAEEQPAEEQPAEEAPTEDERDAEIAKLQAQIEELNNIIVQKDELIGELRKKLEETDSRPAEEQLKSQKVEHKTWFKARY